MLKPKSIYDGVTNLENVTILNKHSIVYIIIRIVFHEINMWQNTLE